MSFINSIETLNSFEVFLKELIEEGRINDLRYDNIPDRVSQVQKNIDSVTDKICVYLNQLWTQYQESSEKELFASEVQRRLVPYFYHGDLNKSARDKPFGYPGDYLTIALLLLPYSGNYSYDILINQFSRNIAIGKGHKNRVSMVYDLLSDLPERSKILSVGCGPAFEIQKLRLKDNFDQLNISLLDFQSEALEFVESKIGKCENVEYLDMNIRDLFKMPSSERSKGSYDFIYCCGMFDYCTDKTASALTKGLYDMLVPGGRLVISNVADDVSERMLFEHISGWKMHLRNEDSLISLTRNFHPKKIETYRDSSKSNVFIDIIAN